MLARQSAVNIVWKLDPASLFDALADAIVVVDARSTDAEPRITFVNAAFERLSGWRRDELVGSPVGRVIAARSEHPMRAFASSREARVHGRTIRAPMRHRDTSEREVEITLSLVTGSSTEPAGIVATIRSIAGDRHQARQLAAARYLRAASELAVHIVGRHDLEYVLGFTTETVVSTFDAEVAQIWISERDDQAPAFRTSHGAVRDFDAIAAGVKTVAKSRKPYVNNAIRREGDAFGFTAIAVLPLLLRQELYGVLVTCHPQRIPAELLEALGTVAALLTASINDARLLRKRQQLVARLQAERTHFHSLLLQAPAAIAILRGADHVYELSNETNNAILGTDPTGKRLRDAFPWMTAAIDTVERVRTTGVPVSATESPLEVIRDGATLHLFVNVHYEPMRGLDGTIEGVMIFGFDVTQIVAARKQLEQAVRLRDDFLAVAGHELRTPLAALLLQVESLQAAIARGSIATERIAERLGKVERHANRLHTLIAQLLDVSRIAGGRLVLQPESLDLRDVVADVIERFAPQAEAAGSVVTLVGASAELRGTWDRLRLEHVIANILSNAVKYGAGQPIEIALAATDHRVTIAVRDRGIGIAPDDHERIFKRFERAVSSQNYGGLGLGLWIVREIVNEHGGEIRLDSAPGRGTVMEIELPRGST